MSAKKKPKKTAKKAKAKKSHKKKDHKQSLMLKGLKWLFVAGLWCGIFLTLLTAWYAAELPSIIDTPHFKRHAAITIVADDESTLSRYGELKGMNVAVEDLPNHLIYAVLAVEDRRFYEHHGIDPVGIARAMARNLRSGHIAQGGSTITQQLAKNLFLSRERTLKRKIQEALLALWLERKLTKDEILTAYLNRVYLGSGAYGVDAAAHTYFHKPATELTLYESALMAGLLKAPSRYSPLSNPTLAAQRARTVLNAMADAGYITQKEAKSQSLAAQAMLKKPGEAKREESGNNYFTDWITGNLDDLIGTTDRNITVHTTLLPEVQKAAEDALEKTVAANKDRDVTQGAVIVMDKDGAILAMVGGVNYAKSQFNRATQARRPPGSAFKPIVYLTALENGWNPYDKIDDSPLEDGDYKPENFEREYMGEVSLTTALTHSLNAATVRLMKQVGIGNVISTARKLGIKSDLQRDLSLALGSSGIPLIELVSAYATIANDGTIIQPYAIDEIDDDNGTLLYIRTVTRKHGEAVDPSGTKKLTRMLQNVIENGTGRRAKLPFSAAGKTGTSQDFRDAWFVGYTGRYIAGVWLGNDDNSPMKGVTGGSLPADVWRESMLAAHDEHSKTPLLSSSNDNDSGFFGVLERIFNQ